MNPALTIARKEYQLAMRNLSTYIVLGIFLVFTGFYFGNTAFKVGLAELRGIFGFMHTLFLFFIPALTMGSITRERHSGTLELISTLPIRRGHIIWGKFLAAFGLLKTVLLLSLVYPVLVLLFGSGFDIGAALSGYLGLLCAGAAYIAIGIFASSLSDNQVLAFILGLAISAVFYLLGHLGSILSATLFTRLEFFGFDYHLQSFFKGVIDTRDLLYFAVVAYIFALLAQMRLQAQNLAQEK